MSFIFPNLATVRASRNLVIFEYNPGGGGLDWQQLWVSYQNYMIGTFFVVMVWALVSQFTIGYHIEKYLDKRRLN